MSSGRIPREFIDDLLTRADVVDVINARVPLKKKGREYTACCPFHNEKSPSFTVSPFAAICPFTIVESALNKCQ